MRSHRHMAMGLASSLALVAASLPPEPDSYDSNKATGSNRNPARLSKAEKKRERKARQRARLLAQNTKEQL